MATVARPAVLVFDVIETLIDIEVLEPYLARQLAQKFEK